MADAENQLREELGGGCEVPGSRNEVEALQVTLKALHDGLNDPPFNYFIHSAPFKADAADAYHWHLELIPKLSTAAGFELGTGMWINVVKPEESAAFLRDRINSTVEQPA